MADQQQKLINKQYNSPINLYSDRNVREILERETKVLANGAVGIDFNNPMTDKPTNLQNSAVLRMLEEEESRKRNGQPGSLKRVAWPPPQDSELAEFIEQEPVHSQGGPLYSSPQSASGLQNNQVPSPQPQIQQPFSSPDIKQQPPKPQQSPQPPLKSHINTNNTFEPIISPSTVSSQSAGQSPYQSAPLSPNVSKSPVSFTNLAKPWSLQNQSAPHFKPVQPPSLRTIQSYQSSEQYHYHQQSQEQTRETQTVVLPPYQPLAQETTFQQYQAPAAAPAVETQRTFEAIKSRQEEQQFAPQFSDFNQNNFEKPESSRAVEVSETVIKPSSTSIEIQRQVAKPQPSTPVLDSPKLFPDSPKPVSQVPLLRTAPTVHKVTPPNQSLSSTATKGLAQNQAPAPQRYQVPVKQIEPPPSTITLRPQAPVSQAPPPLVTSQPATATLRGGKNLRGDLKWPPENVKEKMAAEEHHLVELSHGPACRPRKNCKDYSSFFAKHALLHAYPGYKIPPGTQFYDHNPVM